MCPSSHNATGAESNRTFDNRKRPNRHVVCQLRCGIDDGGRMNSRLRRRHARPPCRKSLCGDRPFVRQNTIYCQIKLPALPRTKKIGNKEHKGGTKMHKENQEYWSKSLCVLRVSLVLFVSFCISLPA